MRCWICYTITSKYILLPEKEDDFILPKNKETYEVKHIEPFVFLYYICCDDCLNNYLNIHSRVFKTLKKREIGINI